MKTREEIHNEMVEKTDYPIDYNIRYARIQIDLLLDIRELLTPILVRRPDIPDKVSEDLRNGVPDNCKEAHDNLLKRITKNVSNTVDARTWLRQFLAEGPRRSTEVYEAGKEEGYSDKTLQRAMKRIGGRIYKIGPVGSGCWMWRLTYEDGKK
jgi:hypothetical protein